jgi:hypothetical protein
MPLKLPPDRPRLGIDKDRPDYVVYCGGWAVGRIYEKPRHRAGRLPETGLRELVEKHGSGR